MGRLKKEQFVYERNEKEELLPVEIPIEAMDNESILATPIPQGELTEILSAELNDGKKTSDEEIIKKHCIEPSFSDEDLANGKLEVKFIATAIVAYSLGVSQKDLAKASKEALIKKAEDRLKKN